MNNDPKVMAGEMRGKVATMPDNSHLDPMPKGTMPEGMKDPATMMGEMMK